MTKESVTSLATNIWSSWPQWQHTGLSTLVLRLEQVLRLVSLQSLFFLLLLYLALKKGLFILIFRFEMGGKSFWIECLCRLFSGNKHFFFFRIVVLKVW